MEEEEDVDIVGGEDAYMSRNEREISCLSSGQILSCDYTVHPQWLADNADATVHWPDHFPKQSSQDEMEMVQDEVVIEEPAPIDFAWCEEVANCGGDIILEQDIPTTQEEEVFTNASSVEQEETVQTDVIVAPTPVEMPPAIQVQHSQRAPIASPSRATIAAHPRSLLKRNLLVPGAAVRLGSEPKKPPSKFRQTLLVNRSMLKPVTATMQQHLAGVSSAGLIPQPIVKRILQQATVKIHQQPAAALTDNVAPVVPPSAPAKPKPSVPRQTPSGIRTVPPAPLQSAGHSKKPKTPAPASTSTSGNAAPKFRQTIKVPNTDVFQNKRMRQLSKELRMRSGNAPRKTTAKTTTTTTTNAAAYDDGSGKPNRGKTSKSAGKSSQSNAGGKSGQNTSSGASKRGAKKFVSLHGENITINHEAECGSFEPAEQPPSAAFPSSTVAVQAPHRTLNYASQTDGDESDDVDIESDSTSSPPMLPQRFGGAASAVVHVELPANRQQHIGVAGVSVQGLSVHSSQPTISNHHQQPPPPHHHHHPTHRHHLTHSISTTDPPELAAALSSLGIPDAEIEIDPGHISALEMHFHREFFEGRPTKTPERFLKIRNYIIQAWQDARPAYVSKTMVRQGLRHCGDVNCISRIHSLLEQIGAINFGCEQLQYVRPLRDLSDMFAATPARSKLLQQQLQSDALGAEEMYLPERRQRNVKLLTADESPDIDANYTVSHEDGRILLPSASSSSSHNSGNLQQQHRRLSDSSSDDDEAASQSSSASAVQSLNKRPTRHKKPVAVRPEFQLIECMRFNRRDRPAPFRVSITMSTLMCLQLHSLSARHEVMGFLGGHRDEGRGGGGGGGGVAAAADGLVTLRLNRYKPCATSAQSGTMCEMCPVSQVQQSANLIADGYDILGWFHSHPAFPPNPSRTDVATQANMQLQFSFDQNRPFIGFILGCVDMKFKCVYVLPGDVLHVSERTVPYELDVEIVKDCSNFSSEIADVFDVIKANCDDYSLVLKKFTTYAKVFLQRHGYGKDVLAGLNNIMA